MHDTREEPGHDGDHAGDHEGHADIDADYRFECARPDELRRLSLTSSGAFPPAAAACPVRDRPTAGGAELTATNAELAL